MAAIDYGALVIKNGIPINKNCDLFQEPPEYFNDDVKGNYYVYCGDEEYSLCFYKCYIAETRNGQVIDWIWNFNFKSETFYRDGVTVTIRRLDDLIPVYPEHLVGCATWEDYVRTRWIGATGKEKDCELVRGHQSHKLWNKRIKEIGRKKPLYYTSTLKYSATWEYKGDKWEVIFGYGIDPNEEIFNDMITHSNYNYGTESARYIREKFFDAI